MWPGMGPPCQCQLQHMLSLDARVSESAPPMLLWVTFWGLSFAQDASLSSPPSSARLT